MRRAAIPVLILVLIGVVAASLFAGLNRTPPAARTDAELETAIRDYLLANPEVIFEAAEIYQQRQAALVGAATEDSARELLPELRAGVASHIIPASGEADVLVVEFFDYNCGFCRRAAEFTLDIHERYDDVTLVLQELPVISPQSAFPARLSLSQANTDGYLDLHMAMMQASGLVDAEQARRIGLAEGLDAATLDAVLQQTARSEALQSELDRSREIARTLGIDGTPAFLIADESGEFIRIISGYDPDRVLAAIEEARTRG